MEPEVPVSVLEQKIGEREQRDQEEKGTTEDEMAGWHHGLNEHESE